MSIRIITDHENMLGLKFIIIFNMLSLNLRGHPTCFNPLYVICCRGGFRRVSGVSENPFWVELQYSRRLFTELFNQPLALTLAIPWY